MLSRHPISSIKAPKETQSSDCNHGKWTHSSFSIHHQNRKGRCTACFRLHLQCHPNC